MNSKAYECGYIDGLEWDLDGFDDWNDVRHTTDGWAFATISAMGVSECRRAWDVPEEDDDAWSQAIDDYDRGAYRGVTAPEGRRGMGPQRGYGDE